MSPSAEGRLGAPNYVFRAVLGVLGAVQLADGLYALLAPRSFYEDFPLGRGWVEALPAYNEHLVRDVGSLFLATAVVLFAAAFFLERRLVTIALLSFLAFSVPHFAYHAFNLEPYSAGDAIANMVGLLFTVVAPIVLLVLMRRRPATMASTRTPTTGTANGANGRIVGVPDSTRNPLVRYAYRSARRSDGEVLDPLRIFAHHPTLLAGYGSFELATRRAGRVDGAAQAPGRAARRDALRLRVVPRLRLRDQRGGEGRCRGLESAGALPDERSLQ